MPDDVLMAGGRLKVSAMMRRRSEVVHDISCMMILLAIPEEPWRFFSERPSDCRVPCADNGYVQQGSRADRCEIG